jgi:hypothetical protein
VHVSLEEFARTLSVGRENRERFREGGVRHRALAGHLRAARATGELDRYRELFERFRAFDRPNVLHVFATFRRDPAFAREFPNAVQTGPLWPRRFRARSPPSGWDRAAPRWVWYASPASAERIAGPVARALAEARPGAHLLVRSPRPWKVARPSATVDLRDRPLGRGAWERAFRSAELRIATGSRTLLEALEVGGPFLYFNGLLGRGAAARRHRPEKIVALLAAERDRWPPDLRRDLRDFAAGRRVGDVVRRAAVRAGGWGRFPSGLGRAGFPPPYDDAGRLIVEVARALAVAPAEATGLVARVRARSNP